MLIHLHVKNFALIDEIEADFTHGLNILTGETGAGKSILLGSINLALGGKADKDSIREGCEYAFVELLFKIENDFQRDLIKSFDIFPEEDILIIQRKILPGRSISKICGETVTVGTLKAVASAFLDIYGQHDYQNLLQPKKHIEFLDLFAGKKIEDARLRVESSYKEYCDIRKKLATPAMDSEVRLKEIDFAKFEISEIENANLIPGEEDELAAFLKKAENSEKILQALNASKMYLSEMDESAENSLDKVLREIGNVSSYDEEVSGIEERLNDAQSIISDISRDISRICESMDFDPVRLNEARERYDCINHLQMKYKKSTEEILSYCEQRKKELEELENFEETKALLELGLKNATEKLAASCKELSEIRKEEALKLEKEITVALKELNFDEAVFKIDFEETQFSSNGFDNVSFLISTNKGESLKLLSNVASGGELSRIMLSIKTVIADKEGTGTLIFDEIDSGISGMTAWMVSKKLGILSKEHQIILITHLPQIAAMADNHFRIYKEEQDSKVVSRLENLSEEGSLNELARLLGSDTLTEAALTNAKELKKKAKEE